MSKSLAEDPRDDARGSVLLTTNHKQEQPTKETKCQLKQKNIR